MALPTLKTLRQADIARLYDTSLPWVETAAVSGLTDFPVRMEYPVTDDEGKPRQRDLVRAYVRKTSWPAPAYRDTVTINGTAWRVAEVTHANAWEWELKFESNVGVGFKR